MGIPNIAIITVLITTALYCIAIYLRSKTFLHMIQLEGYKNKNYLHWISEFKHKAFGKKLTMLVFLHIIAFNVYLIMKNKGIFEFAVYVAVWAILLYLSIDFGKVEAKKALVFTARAKRLFAINLSLILLPLCVTYFILGRYVHYPVILFLGAFIFYLIPYIMYLANICAAPIEKGVFRHYYRQAYQRVRTFDKLPIVGITGSYGKTTTKFVTAEILEEKFKVLKTPESYNTPMGISKVINGTLSEEHEVFVVEMGARQRGDIKEVAELANPKIGVLTSIGPTHMDTQKTIENIMKTKYELIECLPENGTAIFNYDNPYVRELADKTAKKKLLFGLEEVEKLDLYATDIEASAQGSTFMLKDRDGNSVACSTRLLGKHNISNLLAGAAVAKALGLSMEEIARGIARVSSVPHRLELINPGTGVIVIDDAFNSNPDGAKAALEVLAQFREGRRVIVTPGMVELGDQEEEAHKNFGKHMAEVCSFVILIGEKRTRSIVEGLKEGNFPMENLFVVATLDEATKTLQSFIRPKDVVLFENDLPDNYNE